MKKGGADTNAFVAGAKKLWGSGQPRGFKLAAWGVAIGAAVALNQFSAKK